MAKEKLSSQPDKEFNLLSDKGSKHAYKLWKSRIYKICSLLMAVMVLLSTVGYVYWYQTDVELKQLDERLDVLNQRLLTYQDVYQLMLAYNQRLKLINDLWQGVRPVGIASMEEVNYLTQVSEGRPLLYKFKDGRLEAQVQQHDIYRMNELIKLLEQKLDDQEYKLAQVDQADWQPDRQLKLVFSISLKDQHAK